MKRGPAVYQCLSCGFTWQQAPAQVKCPCGSKHVKWVNYEEWARRDCGRPGLPSGGHKSIR